MGRFTIVLLVARVLVAAQADHQQHLHHSAEDYARELTDSKRDAWQKPDDVIAALKLKPSDTVADIGAGPGYFARRFAKYAGKVYAVDINADLLKRAADGAPSNLETVLAAADDPKLPPAGVDVVFFCNALHHIGHRPEYYPKLAAALKPGGRIVIIEFYKKQLPVGPPPAMKLAENQVIAELKSAGFRLVRKHTFLPYQYFFEFTRE